MRFPAFLLIFTLLFSGPAYPIFTKKDLEAIAKGLVFNQLSYIIESIQVIVALEAYASAYRERANNPAVRIKEIKILYNSDKFNPFDLTENHSGKKDALSDEDSKSIKKDAIASYKEKYPSFNPEECFRKNYILKTERIKPGEPFGSHGFGYMQGGLKMKLKADQPTDETEEVTISSFEDKNKSMPLARVVFGLFDKQKNEVIDKKVLWLEKKDGIWVVVKEGR